MFKNYRVQDYNFRLTIYVISLSILGILVIGSAAQSLQSRQIMGFAIGLLFMFLLSIFDFKYFLKFYWAIYIVNILLLLFVQIFGSSAGGAQRWVSIVGIRFQPSETCKIMLILFFAMFITKHKESISKLGMLLILTVLFLPPLSLVYIQPDLSTSIIIVLIFIGIIFVGGISYKIVLTVLAVTIPTLLILYNIIMQPGQTLINDYQKNRILAWRNPEEFRYSIGAQQSNSMMAIGSGQLEGKGLNNNVITSVKNGDFIPAPQTDFIFAIIGEELGFIGASITIILIFLVVFECFIIAKRSNSFEGKLVASGIGTLIGFQGFVNMAVATGLLPTTGIPLPFVSYGLTSLISCFIGIGIVLNIGLQCERTYIKFK